MPTYTFTNLDPSGTSSYAEGINYSGEVAGYYVDSSTNEHGFLYSNGSYTTLDDPSAAFNFSYGAYRTRAAAINSSGEIVGYYYDGNGLRQSFVEINGTYTNLMDPAATFPYGTVATAINDSGVVAGNYYTSNANEYGFLYSNGVYTTLSDPLAVGTTGYTYTTAINASGEVVGTYYANGLAPAHGFLYSNGAYTTLDDPLAGPEGTEALAINASGEVAGFYYSGVGVPQGFVEVNGVYTTLIDPSAGTYGFTVATAINDSGAVAGYYVDNSNTEHGFVYSNGTYTTLDDPSAGSVGTYLSAINALGEVAGTYVDGRGISHAFVAEPLPVPFMSDVVKNANNSLTTLSGMAEASSSVSVYDGKTLIGTVAANSAGHWSLQANVTGGTVHSYTETATDLAGNTGSSAGVTLFSQSANHTLTGGSGNDFLIAGPNDHMTGGLGNDTFVFNPSFGKDVVTDFDVNHDSLAFAHTLFSAPTALQVLSQTHDTNAGAVITVDANDTITLSGVTEAMLAAHVSDFQFS